MGQDETNQNKERYSIGFDIIPLLYNTKCLPNKLLKEDYVPYNLTLTILSKNNYSYRIGANLFYSDYQKAIKWNPSKNWDQMNNICGAYFGIEKNILNYKKLDINYGGDVGYLFYQKKYNHIIEQSPFNLKTTESLYSKSHEGYLSIFASVKYILNKNFAISSDFSMKVRSEYSNVISKNSTVNVENQSAPSTISTNVNSHRVRCSPQFTLKMICIL
ncbi:hypothetical protein FACS1894153_1070 [Bacteroidia bacterium]|nr:hypothetical protein FACS1894153_1070 [Bacteroidia bacterium]